MSITILDWQLDASDYAKELERKIPNNNPIQYPYWDFCENALSSETQLVSIQPWCEVKTSQYTYKRFIEMQYHLLSILGKFEIEKNMDLSHVKRRFLNAVIECCKENLTFDQSMSRLENLFPGDMILAEIPKWEGVDYESLLIGMKSFDITNNKKPTDNSFDSFRKHVALSEAYKLCSDLYNYLANAQIKNIAASALKLACYSGMKGEIVSSFDEVPSLIDEKIKNSGMDKSFLIQMDYCTDSMLTLLGKINDKKSFKKQYFECLIAMFYFGTCDTSWKLRYGKIRY